MSVLVVLGLAGANAQTSGSLACQDHINASLNSQCVADLSLIPAQSGGNSIVIKDGNVVVAPIIGSSYGTPNITIGKTYTYEIANAQGNKCWGTIKFEDKLAPAITCPATTAVACNANVGFSASEVEIVFGGTAGGGQITSTAYLALNSALSLPQVTECSARRLYYSDVKNLSCQTGPALLPPTVGTITRTFRVTDEYGNTSSCTQLIVLNAPSLAINVPNNFTANVCPSSIDLANYEPAALLNSPFSANAYPNGLVPSAAGDCMLSATKTDKVVDAACGKRIVRTWVVVNMCTGTVLPLGANQAGQSVQTITLTDNQAPAITGNGSVTVSTGATNCLSNAFVAFPAASDNCGIVSRTLTINGITYTATPSGMVAITGLGLTTATNPAYVGFWRAVDACGNATQAPAIVTVLDRVSPIAVADQNTNVSMTLDCTATVNASTFDDGSLDNCCLDVNRFEVKRMVERSDLPAAGNTEYASKITFDKADLAGGCSNTVMVVFRVWDCNNNSNTAMVNVKLEDKIGPVAAGKDTSVTCGNAVSADEWINGWEKRFSAINLLSNYPPLQATNPGYFDNCDATVTWGQIGGAIDQCSTGGRSRQATITDKCGRSVTANFSYNTAHAANFEVTLPGNTRATCPGSGVQSKADAIAAARASLRTISGCPVVAIDIKNEEVFSAVNGACYRIKRTWVVTSLCHNTMLRGAQGLSDSPVMGTQAPFTYKSALDGDDATGANRNDDKYVEYVQTIDVVDSEKPAISGAKAPTLTGVGKCGINMLVESFTATDACVTDGAYGVVKSWELLDANKNSFSTRIPLKDNTSASPASQFPANYTFPRSDWGKTFYVRLRAEDRCGNIDLVDYKVVPSDIIKPTPVCYQGLSVDLMPTTGTAMLTATMFDAGSSDGCLVDVRNVNLAPAVSNASGSNNRQFSADNTVELRVEAYPFAPITLNAAGQAIAPATNMVTVGCVGLQPIRLWAIDAAGNADYCNTWVDVQNNMNATPAVSTPCGGTVNGARSIAGAISTSNGRALENTVVTVESSTSVNGKMTSGVKAGKYNVLVGIGSNVKVAADKNDNPLNGVSTFDLVLISKHILGTQNISDRFAQIAADVNNNGKITTSDVVELRKMILGLQSNFNNNKSWRFFDATMNEEVSIKNIQDDAKIDFTAVKVGDINGNANAASAQRAVGTYEFNVADKSIAAGELVTVALNGTEGFGFTMNYDAKSLEVVSVDENSAVIENGTITTAQVGSEFNVTFKALANVTLSNAIAINSNITAAEAVVNGQLNNVALKFNNKVSGFELFQNQPNPFRGATLISFNAPVASDYVVTITDIAGRVVSTATGVAVKGMNNVTVEMTNAGVYNYTVTTGNFTATKKMIVTE